MSVVPLWEHWKTANSAVHAELERLASAMLEAQRGSVVQDASNPGEYATSAELGLVSTANGSIAFTDEALRDQYIACVAIAQREWNTPKAFAESLADVQPELDTDRNAMPGYWHTEAPQDQGVRAGYVELYFRTSQRLFVLKFPSQEDKIFRLKLPANPMRTKYRAWSDWQNPDFVAKAGQQPSRPSGSNDYQIRYKMDYQDR